MNGSRFASRSGRELLSVEFNVEARYGVDANSPQLASAIQQRDNVPLEVAQAKAAALGESSSPTQAHRILLVQPPQNSTPDSERLWQDAERFSLQGNWEMAFDRSTRATFIADDPDYQSVMARLSREDQIAYRNIFFNSPLERIAENLRMFERGHEELGLGDSIARTVAKVEALQIGIHNQNANVDDMLAMIRSGNWNDYETNARKFLTDIQPGQIMQSAADIIAATCS